jgi:hypothetical protein
MVESIRPDYRGIEVRGDLVDAHVRLLEHLRQPGAWFSGAERLDIARESRNASSCGLCAERKAALSPFAVAGRHETVTALPLEVVDVLHRVRTDSGRLSRKWFDGVRSGLEEGPYVEAVGIVTMLAGVDHFCRALGVPPLDLPEAAPGEPSAHVPEGLSDQGAWVPMLAPEDARGLEADIYGALKFVPNIVRALSQVPDHVRLLREISGAHYIALEGLMDPTIERDLDRFQIELVAARVSAMNECFY